MSVPDPGKSVPVTLLDRLLVTLLLLDLFRKLCKAKQLGYLNLEVLPPEPPKDKNGKPLKKKADLRHGRQSAGWMAR